LRDLYFQQAASDREEIKKFVHEISPNRVIPDDEVKLFCDNVL